MIPAVAARGEQDDVRLEGRGIVEAADIDADIVRLRLGFVVERRTAGRAEALALARAGVGGAQGLAHLALHVKRPAGEHHDAGMAATGVLLAVAALALEAADRRLVQLVPNGTALAAA